MSTISEALEELNKIDDELVKVINIKGSADKWPCANDNTSWIEFYKNSKEDLKKCCVDGCEENATDGAHVFKVNDLMENKFNIYVIPMCKTHNNPNNEKEMYVREPLLLDVSDQCKYKDVEKDNKEILKKYLE